MEKLHFISNDHFFLGFFKLYIFITIVTSVSQQRHCRKTILIYLTSSKPYGKYYYQMIKLTILVLTLKNTADKICFAFRRESRPLWPSRHPMSAVKREEFLLLSQPQNVLCKWLDTLELFDGNKRSFFTHKLSLSFQGLATKVSFFQMPLCTLLFIGRNLYLFFFPSAA